MRLFSPLTNQIPAAGGSTALGTAGANPEVFICIYKDMNDTYSFTLYLKNKYVQVIRFLFIICTIEIPSWI